MNSTTTTRVARATVTPLELESGRAATPPKPPSTSPLEELDHLPEFCCQTALKAFVATLLGLSYLAIQVSCICFAVSGAVFLAEEYNDIPSCAGSYRGWGIAMTVIYGLGAFRKQNSDSGSLGDAGLSDQAKTRALGCAMLIVSIFPGVIAGLGNRDVLQQSSDCSLASIPQLEAWTTWIIYWNIALCSGLLLVGGGCLVAP